MDGPSETTRPARWGRRWLSGSRARRCVIGAALVAVVAGAVLAGTSGSGDSMPDSMDASSQAGASDPVGADTFATLAARHSNYCSLDPPTVMAYPDDQRMQGSCCNAMDRAKYRHQLDGLRTYADIAEIPQDPYDIDAGLAKELLGYDETIALTGQDKATFDQAMGMTEDGGPCCCQCWRWYMTEGLDKFLITRRDISAAEVAEITDLTNGCGGPLESADSS